MEQNSNNQKNSTETNNNMNLKQKYNALKQKIANLEKNNNEMLEMYKAEEQRLIKSNEFLMQNKNQENSRNIQNLEAEVIKMRNNIKELQDLMEPKNGNNLILENNDLSNNSTKKKLTIQNEEKIKEEYIINYKNKLKAEFEKKLITKHLELINYYTLKNQKILQNNLNKDDIVDIDEIKYFSIKENNDNDDSNNDSISEDKEVDIHTINLLLSLLCLKEEYPKDFFIDYILDESYSERGHNNAVIKYENKITDNKITKNKKQGNNKRQSALPVFKEIKGFDMNNKISEKICHLFGMKNKEDIDIIKSYINEISKIDDNLRNYFDKHLNKYRFAPFEKYEQDNFDAKIKSCFGKHSNEIQELLKKDENIISYQSFHELLDKWLKEDDKENDFIFYIMNLMKLSKSERKNQKVERLKSLKILEFNLIPFYKKIIN